MDESSLPPVAPPPDEAAVGEPPAPSGGARWAIWGLGATAVFLLLAIGAVVAARQVRARWLAPRSGTEPAARSTDEWLAVLQQGDDGTRRRAAQAIVVADPAALRAALERVCSLPDGNNVLELDRQAVRALAEAISAQGDAARAETSGGTGGSREMIQTLGEALAADSAAVRVAAAAVFREIRRHPVDQIGALAAALADENRWVRWYAAEALANVGAEASLAVDALCQALDHEDRYTRRRAAVALGRIGPAGRPAIARLESLASDDPDRTVREAARTALFQVNLDALAAARASQADSRIQELIARLDEDDEFESVAAANALGRLGPEAAAAAPALARALGKPNKWLRVAAAEALGAIGPAAGPAVASLEEAADDADADVRAAARASLESLGRKPTAR